MSDVFKVVVISYGNDDVSLNSRLSVREFFDHQF